MNAYIDATYYTSLFKANKNAMITGTFNNVDANMANFEAFALRGSELANRLLNNKVERLGGIDFVSPTPRDFIKKAVACFVQNWFIQGYTMADLNNTLNIGSFSFSQIKSNATLRMMISVDGIINLQATEMWDGIALGVDIEMIQKAGYCLRDILFTDEAFQLFQLKGNYDDNFHVDINYGPELTGQAGLIRWINIAKTDKQFVSFEIMGGSKLELAKALLMIDRDNFAPGHTNAYIYTQQPGVDNGVSYFVLKNGTELQIWVQVADDTPLTDAHLLISNIFADDKGDYKLFGSQTVTVGTEVQKANILQAADVTVITQRVTALETLTNTHTTQINSLQTEIAAFPATITTANIALGNSQANATAISTVNGNIESNRANISLLETFMIERDNIRLTTDGSISYDPAYQPTQPTHGTPKSYVDQKVADALTAAPSVAGWFALWSGTLAGTKPTTGDTMALQFAVSGVTASTGTFSFAENNRFEWTFENGTNDDNPEIMYCRTDAKLNKLEIEVDPTHYYKGNLNVNGTLTVKKYQASDDTQVDLPVGEIQITRGYQINGVQAQADLNMDDATVVALEAVVIS